MNGEHVEFIELVFPMTAAFGMDEREEIEDTLHSRLVSEGIGEVSGAGAGMGVMNVDVDIEESWQYRVEDVRGFVLALLGEFTLPPGSTMRLYPFSEARNVVGGRSE
ncbi:hypothetical protein [Deinococcus sedimenti]|uniref:Uncharacterized protein n=1 Tax=Deinococcus sedimenti TaxID=1867090 RepID=A0ABQ2SAE1_9DEIO|nr:hypothetical protein [Deinococcus sedimenti]GGS07578.1 hypothetical protein GCM10008960_37520 [Deinococcus sedimenti]